MMENNIVKDFEKLRVIAACNIEGMDELVNDLANALEETSTVHRVSSADDICDRQMHARWKKRSNKRRTLNKSISNNHGNSEPHESSRDDTNLEFTDCFMKHSDSDDQFSEKQSMTKLRMPENFAYSIESDSVTENCSPVRPQRRRRKFKSMAIEPLPSSNVAYSKYICKSKQFRRRTKNYPMESDWYLHTSNSKGLNELMMPGKRKRSSTSRSEPYTYLNSGSVRSMSQMADGLENLDHQDSSSLTTSISDSDDMGMVTNDEAREADDEQSDFFHEAGPSSASTVWDRRDSACTPVDRDDTFELMLRRQAYKQSYTTAIPFQLNSFFNKTNREIKAGRRKFKERKPRYTMTRFIQDRQNWKVMQAKYASCWPTSRLPGQRADHKRRKAFPCSPVSGFIDEGLEPEPEASFSNLHPRRTRRRMTGSQSHMSLSSDS